MKDFEDRVEKTIPEEGHVTTRTRARVVPHGVNIETQIRTLKSIDRREIMKHAIASILVAGVSQGVDRSDVRLILDEAESVCFDEPIKRWNFGNLDGEVGR
jgi:predicted secreted Zn-dependent protease